MKLKRIMAIVLCFAMVLSTMSFNVFAEEGVTETADTVVAKVGDAEFTDIQEAIKEAAPTGTVTLLGDVTVDKWNMISESLTIGDGTIITLDMEGLTIDGDGHTLTVNDVESAGNGGHLIYDGDYNIYDLNLVMGENVNGLGITSGTIENVTFSGGRGTSGGAAIHVNDGLVTGVHAENVTIDGCTFKNNGGAIYFETAQDDLVVEGNTFDVPSEANVILLRGTAQFIGNTVVSGRTVNVVSGSPVVTGNNFGDVRLKVYNAATATIEGNTINNLVFENAESEINAIFKNNILSEEAQVALGAVTTPEAPDDGGSDGEEDTILINTVEDLIVLRDNVNAGTDYYEGKNVKLNADIDLENTNWTPIGSASAEHGFMGNFDGNGHTIYNLTINEPTLDNDGYAYAGLFGVTEGTDKDNQNTIKNLTIENVTITTDGHIASAAIAYPYYTIVENVNICGHIAIEGGNYTAGVLAYTRRCVNAKDLTITGNDGSYIKGAQVVGGVISDIQMNGGLIADYSYFNAEGLTVKGELNVGGISGIIASQTLDTCSVKNVTLDCDDARVGTVAGCLGGVSTISDATVENVSGASALIGGTYDDGKSVEAKIGDKYYANRTRIIEKIFFMKNSFLFQKINQRIKRRCIHLHTYRNQSLIPHIAAIVQPQMNGHAVVHVEE